MLNRRAVFVGAARDCAAYLPGVLDNLARFAATYVKASFLFLVSDSNDESWSILQQWLNRGRDGNVIRMGSLVERLPKRTERIAHLRNAALDEVRRRGWANCDHIVVADLDDVLARPVKAEGFSAASRWLDGSPARAAVLANATPRYYDVWALRHDRWCPRDCWHSIWGRPKGESFEFAKFREVFVRQIKIPTNLAPIEVRSAFGGLGIYRMSYALNARYRGLDDQGREISEHVAFNEQIARLGGKLYIFPPLQVHAPRQHLYQPSEFGLRWRVAVLGWRLAEFCNPSWRSLVTGA
jgi:hypothetical protein